LSEFVLKHWTIFLAVNLAFIFTVVTFGHHHLHDENGLLENFQAFLLFSATILYFRLTMLNDQSEESKRVNMGLSLLCFSFLLREVDIEKLPFMETVGFLFHGIGRTILLVVLWSGFFKNVYDHCEIRLLAIELLTSKYMLFLNISFLLLVVGTTFDKEFWDIEHGRLYEELAETNAYLILIIPAIFGCFYKYRESRNARFENRKIN